MGMKDIFNYSTEADYIITEMLFMADDYTRPADRREAMKEVLMEELENRDKALKREIDRLKNEVEAVKRQRSLF